MPPKTGKGKSCTRLTIGQKIDLLQKMDDGWSVTQLSEHFGVKKETVRHIIKQKDALRTFADTETN